MTLATALVVAIPAAEALCQGARVTEARLGVISGRSTTAALGAAISFGSAGYTRFTLAGAVGPAWHGGETRTAAHVDAVVRFFLDPYRSSRWGLYGAGGLSALYDGFNDWRGLLLLAAGMEFPSTGRAAWAVETGLGGGWRVTVALRQTRDRRR